jgi:hypothetical protein
MLVVPLGILGTVTATLLRGLGNDVFFQVDLLTTVGLAAQTQRALSVSPLFTTCIEWLGMLACLSSDSQRKAPHSVEPGLRSSWDYTLVMPGILDT